MDKKLISIWGGILLGSILLVVFFLNIFQIIYFNEKYYKVPNLKTYTLERAQEMLTGTELHIKEMGDEFSDLPLGEIFLQEPEADTIVKKNRNIKVWVSKGSALIDVPNLTGMNFLDAKVIAEQKGLIVDKVVSIKTQGMYNEVVATDPPTNTLMTKGEKVSFLVNGSEQIAEVKMPDLIGKTFDSAIEILTKNTLIVGNVEFSSVPEIKKNVIIKSSVSAGTKIPAGSSIDLVINN
ncbi:PASTA domain-containing protein [Fusobacterium sp.]|uniref:PASTA domain-containing protein n=1 Tax=Fusobacterium sp. TaxID=68766 RepID=UPI0025C40876|nr:PASTA domain-containing protein [Fusobacterium sp.]